MELNKKIEKLPFFLGRKKSPVFPIQYAIPSKHIRRLRLEKKKAFSSIIPGDLSTYKFKSGQEDEYYADYSESLFGLTWKKSGWDTLRHYEILASGSIPYFADIDECPEKSLFLFPKDLIKKAITIPGVNVKTKYENFNRRPNELEQREWKELSLIEANIDHSSFEKDDYREILENLWVYTKKHLTTKAVADYVLKILYEKFQLPKISNCFFLVHRPKTVHYQRDLIIHGLKELLGGRNVVEIPKIDYLYYGSNLKNIIKKIIFPKRDLYGQGFTYANILKPDLLIRPKIEKAISSKYFDIIFMHIGPNPGDELKYWNIVKKYYPRERIIIIDGMDALEENYSDYMMEKYAPHSVYFRREIP